MVLEIFSASSTSTPKYLTVLSILAWPSKSCVSGLSVSSLSAPRKHPVQALPYPAGGFGLFGPDGGEDT